MEVKLLWHTVLQDEGLCLEAHLVVKFQWLCTDEETNGISLSCLSRKCASLRGWTMLIKIGKWIRKANSEQSRNKQNEHRRLAQTGQNIQNTVELGVSCSTVNKPSDSARSDLEFKTIDDRSVVLHF